MALSSKATLLYTHSYDGTADLVVKTLGSENVFRFNFDLWKDYSLSIGPHDFEIRTPAGRTLTQDDVAKVYWRKPMSAREIFPERSVSPSDVYVEEELWYAMRDLVNLFWAQGKVVLVEPFAETRVGKFVQMRLAEAHFEVPPWKFVRGSPEYLMPDRQSIVKSLTLQRVAERAVLYATKVCEHELDPSAPWLIQEYVHADADITVVFVRGALFAFELERSFTDRFIDWREVSLEPQYSHWKPHSLPAGLANSIGEYMSQLSLDYGRLDLLRRAGGDYVFLEVNPHGEWGWLDPSGEYGVLNAIIAEVSPLTPVHPIPVSPHFPSPARHQRP
jgi:hypothetical protein